jgi:hypothetical protein
MKPSSRDLRIYAISLSMAEPRLFTSGFARRIKKCYKDICQIESRHHFTLEEKDHQHSRFSPKTVVRIPRRGLSYVPGMTR